ncbi:MAG: glutamine-hydrolyzing GMP synthase [Pseudomonadota bacterium]
MKKESQSILIIDFGSQFTQLIARRVRENNVYCEIHPANKLDTEFVSNFNPMGIILSGGPSSVALDNFSTTKIDKNIFNLDIPILAICYGQQLTCKMLGGKIDVDNNREFGQSYVKILQKSELYDDIWKVNNEYKVWMSHGDHIVKAPDNFEKMATSDGAPFAIIANEEKKIYGLQFHPEVTHTPEGKHIIKNFLTKICGCQQTWNMHSFMDESIKNIREIVGNNKVICAVSGGVDSTVMAALMHKAIGDNLTCIFIDTGLLRKNEGEIVKKRFQDKYHIPINYVNASSIFLKQLANINDPEQKRKIIGKIFIEIFDNEAKHIGGIKFLGQGTLYPDIIESVSVNDNSAVTIKSHHNVGGLPKKMKLKLIEPLKDLFKDEVRLLGKELGIDNELLSRHPFPGPGLAIRIIGDVNYERLNILQEADHIYIQELKKADLYNQIWQAFAVLLPIKSVGVMGDKRTYEYVLSLRAVTSTDGMTADSFAFSHDFLKHVSSMIINNVQGINRVTYDVTSKPPSTIEWE